MRLPARPAWIAPVKPNVLALGGLIVGVVWVCAHVTLEVVGRTLPTLLTSDVADEVRTAALHLVGVTAGLSWASVALAGLISWGIRLLDESEDPPPAPPTVPASTHEAVVAALTRTLRDDQAAVAAVEAEADGADPPTRQETHA